MKPALLCLLAAPTAAAQTVLLQLGPAQASFGARVAAPGDVDGDGREDVAVSAPDADVPNLQGAGTVGVYSGFDGGLLWQRSGSAHQHLGRRLAAAGDVNGDGVGDLIAASAGTSSVVEVLSGVDGATLHAWGVDVPVLEVAGVGDVDGDGFADVAAGLYNLDVIVQTGIARVWSGQTGDVLHDLGGLAYDTTFGELLAGPGDLDLDGFDDVAGGSEFGARVFSGQTGQVLHELSGATWKPYGLAGAGDVNGDGVPDLAVGEPLQSRLSVLSGVDLAPLVQIDGGGEPIGVGLAALGDVDGDGAGDLAYGGFHPGGPGAVRLASGGDGSTLFTHTVPNGAPFEGDAVVAAGDLSGDGLADLVIGHPHGLTGGFVYVVSSACAPSGSRPFCVAGANSVSASGAKVGSVGSHSLTLDTFELEAWNLPPNEFGLFVWGREPQQVPLGDGFLCVGSTIHRIHPAIPTGAAGEVSLPFDSWAHPFQPGDVIRFQFWYRDTRAPGAGSNLTHGLRVSFCQ